MAAELFDVVTSDNCDEIVGQEYRDVVHRTGLYHRSVNVLLVDGRGRLLIQKRAAGKDICPGEWDLSVAEHLQVGESHLSGAVRGVREELGLDASAWPCTQLSPAYLQVYQRSDLHIDDREWAMLYLLRLPDDVDPAAAIHLQEEEVEAVDWIEPAVLLQRMDDPAHHFTQWFRNVKPYLHQLVKQDELY